jgi:signal transduction histidine kinase/ligand-binding sensor domain-containing protein
MMISQKLSRVFSLFVCCLLWLNAAVAQQFPAPGVAVFGASEGLKQNTLTCIYPDSAGYLWIGTFAGLHRFNGYSFQTFADKNPHLSKELRQVVRDIIRVGNSVYFSTEDHLMKLHLPGDSISVVWKYAVKGNACRIHSGSENQLFLYQFGIDGGIFVLNPFDDSLKKLYNDDVYREYADITFRNDTIAFIRDGRVVAFNLAGELIDLNLLKNNDVESIFFSNAGELILCLESGILKCTLKTGECDNLDFEEFNQIMVWPTRNGFALNVSVDGIYLFDKENALRQQITSKDLNLKTAINITQVNSVTEDYSGNLWLGIDGVGLVRIDRLMPKFNLTPSSSFSGSFVRSVIEDNDDLWAGTLGGAIHQYSANRHIIHQLPYGVNAICLMKHESGELMVTTDKGVYELNLKTSKFKLVDQDVSLAVYTNLVKTHLGRFFTAALSKNSLFEIVEHEQSKRLVTRVAVVEGVRSLFHVSAEKILIAITTGGFRVWDANTNELSHTFMADYKITDLKLMDDTFWIATSTGLHALNLSFEPITNVLPDVLNEEYFYSLATDKNGRLWISSNVGLLCFNPATNILNSFTERHGLQGNEFNTRCALALTNGNLLFGGVSGLNIFNPDEIFPDSHAPVPVIEWVKNAGKEIIISNIELPYIELQQSELALQIKLLMLNVTASERNQFAFALFNGGDTTWSDLGTNRDLFLQSVATGSYSLLGKSANSDGVWSNPVELLKLKITPPFYFTWWFVLIVAGLLGLFIFTVTYLYLNQINERKLAALRTQQEKDAMRQRIADDIHDDLGAGLTRLTLMTRQIGVSNDQNPGQLNKISEMTQDLTETLRQVVWAMKPEFDSVSGLFAGINSYAHEYLSGSGINLQVNLPEKDVHLNPIQRQTAMLVLKESLNNILKHSRAKRVIVSLKITDSQLAMSIEDDGIGFDSDGVNAMSNGLSSMTRRAGEAKGDIKIFSAVGGPTRVLLTLDLNQNSDV